MKKLFLFLTLLSLILSFSACESATQDGVANQGSSDDGIAYATSQGVKIEDIPKETQEKINTYVKDCTVIFTQGFKEKLSSLVQAPYLSFSDVFVYDFSGVNEAVLDEKATTLWAGIKDLIHTGATPTMYVELHGYASYYPEYKVTSLEETALTNGFFIFSDNTVVQMNYSMICQRYYAMQMIPGTTTINCGNKYAEELIPSTLETYNKIPEVLRIK